jgi:hypothetical protein
MRLIRFAGTPPKLLVLAWLAAGCSVGDPAVEAPAPVSQPIIAGTPITGDPAIMSLLSFMGPRGARCTATLITPRLLLTAAHCIFETPGFTRQLFTGNNDGNGTGPEIPVKMVVSNPRYQGAPRQGNDFCIVVLETPLAIRPVRLNRAPVESAQGKTVRYVGFGLTTVGNPNSGGVKRQNTAPLADVSRLLLAIGPNANQVCEGDSGGPLLLDDGQGEAIIGIGSFVDAPACRRNAFYQRIDTQIAWIDEQIQKFDPTGSVPPADGGTPDTAPELKPDVGAPDAMTSPPAPELDARAPEPPSGPSLPTPTPDARAADARGAPGGAPQPPPSTTTGGGAAGGCSFGAARPTGTGAGLLVFALLALAWALSPIRQTSRQRQQRVLSHFNQPLQVAHGSTRSL